MSPILIAGLVVFGAFFYVLIGCILTGLYDRTEGTYWLRSPHTHYYTNEQENATNFGIFLWLFILIYFLAVALGYSPYVICKKAYELAKNGTPWFSWKEYVARKSS